MIPAEITFDLGERMTDDGLTVPVFGFEYNGDFIWNPRVSPCGRFEVQPSYYGLTEGSAKVLEQLNNVFI